MCFVFGSILAQDFSKTYEDFGIWNNVSVSHKWAKKWSSDFDFSLRLDENARELRSAFVEMNLERDLKKKWDVGGVIRFNHKGNTQIIRFSPYLKKYVRFKPFNVKYRFKFDYNYDLTDNSNYPFKEVFRNKIGIEYKRKKHKLGGQITGELFHDWDKQFTLPDSFRLKAGLSYKINKKWDIDIAYIIQEELHTTRPVRDYIISWGISTEL